ncbi:hypothetical protein T06_4305 [Trichinella sp. T6]|nr:hypothetical protein T06_4305 [Trichinella sp. T6]
MDWEIRVPYLIHRSLVRLRLGGPKCVGKSLVRT